MGCQIENEKQTGFLFQDLFPVLNLSSIWHAPHLLSLLADGYGGPNVTVGKEAIYDVTALELWMSLVRWFGPSQGINVP